MYIKICKNCNTEFETRDKRSDFCKSPECQRERARLNYAQQTTTCICQSCNKQYEATRKQSKTLCPDCVRPRHYNFKETHIRELRCKTCNKLLGIEEKKNTNSGNFLGNSVIYKVCDACKQESYKQISLKMKLKNPGREIQFDTIEDYEQTRQNKLIEAKLRYEKCLAEHKVRMHTNNPMFDPAVREKVKQTYRLRKEQGLYKEPDPTKHKNYKGDRGIKQYLRMALSWWRIENFERTNYTCECCGQHAAFLMAHHTEKFSDIVEHFAKQLQVDLKTLEYRSELYNKLEELVCQYHKEHDIGLVVCESCHDSIDKCFHKRKVK